MAQGDSKVCAEYDFQAYNGRYNHSSDTFAYLLVTDAYGDIDANTALNAASFTAATIGGNYAGKTALTSVTWARSAAVSTLDAANISIAADAGNPTDAKCLVVLNDTSAADDCYEVFDLTTDGTTAVDLTNGFTFNFNAAGATTVTTNG
ncbi:MAG: hypothetical protein WA981_00920 [Glaciecola sp.]